MFCGLFRDRRGESLVEVLTASVVFMMMLGTLCAGARFAAGALTRARTLQERASQFDESARRNLMEGKVSNAGAGAISFEGGSFSVPVRFQTVQAEARETVDQNEGVPADEEKTAVFYVFAALDAADGPNGT